MLISCRLLFPNAFVCSTVQDVNLTFWRSYEGIKNDQPLFLNNGEWELVSVLSERNILETQMGGYAQIKFHVRIRMSSSVAALWPSPLPSWLFLSLTLIP